MMYPQDLKYTESHEWVREENDNIAAVGITGFAIEELGDIVFMELPGEGEKIQKGTPFGEVESVKAVFDLNAPVSGRVTDVNSGVADDPGVLKQDPYEEGWLVKVELENKADLEELMDAAQYSRQFGQED